MSGKVEYLEKYSVAPPPSRDYYGIKVLRDEVILFLWKISHGPHRAPAICVTKFSEFNDDKSLQDEIQRVFGNYLLEHVKNITSDKGLSILTLPKNVIARISRYLKISDIINLSTLSHASKEVFDNDVVWETLYRKYKRSKVSKEEKKYVMASSWKQLLKERQLQESLKSQKPLENKAKAFQPTFKETSSRQSSINSTTLKNSNSIPFSKKSAEDSKNLPISESPLRANTVSKIALEKKKINLKSTTSMRKIPDESGNKLLPTNKFKIDSKGQESSTNRSQLTVNKNITKNINSLTKPKSSISLKSTENLKPRKSSVSNILETKLKSNRADSLRSQKLIPDSKIQNKEVGKPKKISESKSTIEKTLLNNLHVDDISSLIEESLKNFKGPRSIFNYDFSVLEDKKSAGDSKVLSPRPEIQNLKKDSNHVEEILNSSARSESQSGDDEKFDMTHFTQKYLNARAEFMQKMSEASSFSKNQSLNNFPLSGKSQKPLSTIPENLKKARASIFAAKGIESKNIIQERPKIRLTKGNAVKK